MASACGSAVMAGARSVAARSKTPLLKNLLSPKSSPPSPFPSSTRASAASRFVGFQDGCGAGKRGVDDATSQRNCFCSSEVQHRC
ncbi:hypothetical protein C3L33_20830, partial [Rhododendron williamsianum]